MSDSPHPQLLEFLDRGLLLQKVERIIRFRNRLLVQRLIFGPDSDCASLAGEELVQVATRLVEVANTNAQNLLDTLSQAPTDVLREFVAECTPHHPI